MSMSSAQCLIDIPEDSPPGKSVARGYVETEDVIHKEYDERYDHGSNQDEDAAALELFPRRPGHFVHQLIV